MSEELIATDKFKAWAMNCDDGYQYLPQEFRDFHDQKDLFKEIFRTYENVGKQMSSDEKTVLSEINWVQAHCFVFDTFLWHMARKGYTLQKARHKFFKEQANHE